MPFQPLQVEIGYNKIKKLEVKPKGFTSANEFYCDTTIEEIKQGRIFHLFIHTKETIVLDTIQVKIKLQKKDFTKVFSNGFQSWSESREFNFDEEIPSLKSFSYPFLKHYGDYSFSQIKKGRGIIHSWTYTYLRNKSDNKIHLFASLNEKMGYTLFYYDANQEILSIEKECKGLELSHSYPALEFIEIQGDDNSVFDTWFEKAEIKKPKVKPAFGWTSWYHYYTNISEEIILKNLQAFKEKNIDINIFQIDDGYQSRVGDWLEIKKEKFPKGMKHLADEIHKENVKAGLWLAPLVAEKKSKLFQNNPSWFLKDEKGKFISVGYNPMWSGHFYALDIYNQEVRQYLTGVFHTILFKWGYDMVKLDFLYGAAVHPPKNKTKGHVMADTMTFLREICKDKIILGCGVPLGPSFGLVDYCRIGADIHLKWEHGFLKYLNNRERVSTMIALRSVLGRWQLNNRAFINDPDVFILRDAKNKLTPTQQHTILSLNALLGRLIFTSDYIGDYSEEQLDEFRGVQHLIHSEIESVIEKNNYYEIKFTNQGNHFICYTNLWNTKASIPNKLELDAFETIVLRR